MEEQACEIFDLRAGDVAVFSLLSRKSIVFVSMNSSKILPTAFVEADPLLAESVLKSVQI